MVNKILVGFLLLLAVGAVVYSCTHHRFRSNYDKANAVLHASKNLYTKPFLKAHYKNGDITILRDTWQIDTVQEIVSGKGTRYDFNRRKIYEGDIAIPIDSIALFETNTKLASEAGRITTLAILGAFNVGFGAFCITTPKACFGSCPTFYLDEDDNLHYADAEAFSHAILPSMEYADIDALGQKKFTNPKFSITMKNEALETHNLKNVKLLAYPVKEGERVYQSTKDRFYSCRNMYPLATAKAAEGDITSKLKHEDKDEWFSLSDESNLNSKEEIELVFKKVHKAEDLGLVIHYRQTLMTTYMFYSAMGYMGDQASDIFAWMETDAAIREQFDTTTKILGNIEVLVWNEQERKWKHCGSLYETGPIAINKHIVALNGAANSSEVKLKLVLNKGLWRIDHVSLTNIQEQVQPLELQPQEVLNKGKSDVLALSQLNSDEKYLISMPGSEYKLKFVLPGQPGNYDLFLYSKGYYLEWMRDSWLADKDLLKLRKMVYQPQNYLQSEAKNYKKYESAMEEQFWNSRINTKTFSYHEK